MGRCALDEIFEEQREHAIASHRTNEEQRVEPAAAYKEPRSQSEADGGRLHFAANQRDIVRQRNRPSRRMGIDGAQHALIGRQRLRFMHLLAEIR